MSSLNATPAEPATRGAREWLTIALLLVGGFAVVLGWILGLGLLWTSRRWTQREKWFGTIAAVVAPIATAIFLARRAKTGSSLAQAR